MDIEVSFPGGKRVVAQVGAHRIETDQPHELGGQDAAPPLHAASSERVRARLSGRDLIAGCACSAPTKLLSNRFIHDLRLMWSDWAGAGRRDTSPDLR
jgi:hypothetical protein